MTQITKHPSFSLLADEAWFDPIKDRIWANVHVTIKVMFEEELAAFFVCLSYGRSGSLAKAGRKATFFKAAL